MTDDQTLGQFNRETMPFTWELFSGDRGAIFANALAVPPLCCPVRAGFLTGQYPHNHGILGNVPGYADLRMKPNVLPAWLRASGYETAFIGKFLNQYIDVGGARPAPGWDEWLAFHGYPAFLDFKLSDDGEVVRREGRREYSTRVFNQRAAELAGDERDRPLFMWLAHNAPHVDGSRVGPCKGPVAAPPDRSAYERFADEPLPRGPAFGEQDRSDKTRHTAGRSPLSPDEIELMTLRWRCALASLPAVDEGMEELVAALEQAGELENTVLTFVSDNGYFFGEHAIGGDKRLPYRAAAQVPMAIWVGSEVQSEAPPAEIGEVAGTFDLPVTLLDYAGAEPCVDGECRAVDGRSLRALLEGRPGEYPQDRAILLELDEPGAFTYEGLRTTRWLYWRLRADRDGDLPRPEAELYDLRADPDELESLAGTRGARMVERRLDARLDRLARCRGSSQELFAAVSAPGDCE